MVVVMQERATTEQVERVVAQLIDMGFDVHRSTGALRTVIGAVGGKTADPRLVEVLDGVQEVLRITAGNPDFVMAPTPVRIRKKATQR